MLLAPSHRGDPEALEHPTFLKAERKLAPRDFIQVMRDHYQGTEYDHYGVEHGLYKYELRGLRMNERRQYQLAPIWGKERLPGTSANSSWVAQLRDWMPNPVGGLLWGGFTGAHACAHIPLYVGIRETPKAYNVATVQPPSGPGGRYWSEYDEKSAYWAFINVFDLVNLFYQKTIDEVQPVWEDWEDKLFKLQPVVEEAALELYGKDPELAVDFLNSYSNAKCIEALEMCRDMFRKILTIIAHHNTPWF
jgi:dipeptidase